MLHHIIQTILPPIISVIELIGIFVVVIGTLRAFYFYQRNLIYGKGYPVKRILSEAMVTGLDFKMAGEILKTVLITSMDELYILGGIILLRALLAFMINTEMKAEQREEEHAEALRRERELRRAEEAAAHETVQKAAQ